MQRRNFLNLLAASGLGTLASSQLGSLPLRATTTKKILVLGGTNFLGPAIVERAIARDHEVTIFNRGITRPHLFPGIEKLRGNRMPEQEELSALQDREWDAVIDVWPERADMVERTASMLADRASFYFFCSSIAVYTDFSQPGNAETASIHADDPGWYGGEKARAEQIIETHFSDRFGVARCHAIFGPRDNGTTFHYWLRRLALEEEVLAPGSGLDPVQFVDVRDVARWIVDCVEQNRVGTYNLTGSREPVTFRAFLEESRDAIGSEARLTWVDPDFLRREQGVRSFSDMPLWAPLDEDAGFYQIDGSKALDAGISYRPLAETARDTWQWYQSYFFKDMNFPAQGIGLSREREIEILTAWAERG